MTGAQKGIVVGLAIIVIAAASFLLLGNRSASSIPFLNTEPAMCPLSGVEPGKEALVERPAVAVKIENNAVAYPLSGLEDAEIVYEEVVEGGITRFMAFYHCTDARKAGPIRSARLIDPAIMVPLTRILAYAGANEQVNEVIEAADIVSLTERVADDAMERVVRAGITSEHTLYGDTVELRRLGRREYSEAPPDVFEFGELEGRSKKARHITIDFGGTRGVEYEWAPDGWKRFDGGLPLVTEAGEHVTVDNVIVEEHEINYSDIKDVLGNPSIEIEDQTGTGRAVLFRDGRAIPGRWIRESVEAAVRFETKSGDVMVLSPGTTWIELVPTATGDVKGSFSYEK